MLLERRAVTTTVLLVDDHQEFRRILRQILYLEPGLEVAGEAGDGLDAVEFVQKHQPNIVLMDVAMPRLDGLEASRRIKAVSPQTKIVVLTVHAEESYRRRARESGADAFLPKQELIEGLVPTIRRVLGQETEPRVG